MKINPLNILLDKNFKTDKQFYFISGNEVTLMEKIKANIIEKYKEVEKVQISNIEKIKDFSEENNLFEEKRIFQISNCQGVDKDSLKGLQSSKCIFIFIQTNSKSTKKIKNLFNKDNDCYLIDCYELDKDTRKLILNEFLRKNNLSITKEIYWFLVERLDTRFIFFENSLNKMLELDKKNITFENIKKFLAIDDSGKEKVFFYLLKRNREIVQVYRDKIMNSSDVNDLYYYSKFFCYLIIDSNSEDEYIKNIPIYLFREKSFLIDIYRKYNNHKKKLLLKLLSSTEKVLRRENDLSLVYGLRFLLNIKRITIS